MVNTLSVAAVAASVLLLPSANAAGMYTKSSPVLQVDAKSYGSLIANSNHTSIVEFYAPWCGHCQSLKPAYEKAAKSLAGLAKVAAIDCDEESNKPLCGQMGVKGFPTLKIVRPGKKPGRPNVEDYQGQRTAKAIVEAVKDKIPNHVKRITDKTLQDWLAEENNTAKAILFTDKGTTSPLLKALAVDFLGSVSVAQIRDKEASAVSTFGVSSFPTVLLLPGGTETPVAYNGEMDKAGLSSFLSQIAPPNPDPAPRAAKPSKSTKPKDARKSKSASSAFSKASASHESADSSASKATQTAETIVDDGNPLESPNPNVVTEDTQKPIELPEIATIPVISVYQDLEKKCLSKKLSTSCILALYPSDGAKSGSLAKSATDALSEIHHKHSARGGRQMPFYAVSLPAVEKVRADLDIAGEHSFTIIATNARKGWFKWYNGEGFETRGIEAWIDSIKMGEGAKQPFPPGLLMFDPEDYAPGADAGEASSADPVEESVAAAEPVAEATPEPVDEPVVESPAVSEPAAPEPAEEPSIGVEVEEISSEMKEKLIQQAKDAAKKSGEEHDEL